MKPYPLKTPKLFERLWNSGYAAAVYNVGWCGVATAAGVIQALADKPWWAGFNFFCAGVAGGCTLAILAVPMRRRDLTDIERSNLERQAHVIFQDVLEDYKRRGVLPRDTDIGDFKVH
jgi:hypothetical protein